MNPEPANCTDGQLAEFLKRSVALELFPRLNDSNAMTDTGIVSKPMHFFLTVVNVVNVHSITDTGGV